MNIITEWLTILLVLAILIACIIFVIKWSNMKNTICHSEYLGKKFKYYGIHISNNTFVYSYGSINMINELSMNYDVTLLALGNSLINQKVTPQVAGKFQASNPTKMGK